MQKITIKGYGFFFRNKENFKQWFFKSEGVLYAYALYRTPEQEKRYEKNILGEGTMGLKKVSKNAMKEFLAYGYQFEEAKKYEAYEDILLPAEIKKLKDFTRF
jgi:hypothetical protein